MLEVAFPAIALGAIAVASALVYRDARRVGVSNPLLWAMLVFWTATLGLGLLLFVPTVPAPGALILVLVGPVVYLFERDDARHGDQPADPRHLDSGSNRSRGADEDDHDRPDRDAES